MQLVERPAIAPGHCIVNLSSEDPGGFVDTMLTPAVVDPRVYVSRQAVIDMGRLFGFAAPDDVAELRARVDALEHEIADLHVRVAEADKFAEAAEYTLNTFDTRIRNKPGRPKNKAAGE